MQTPQTPQPTSESFDVLRGSPDRFGYEWSVYSKILPESKGQLERWLGRTGLDSCAGKKILDVGCGMGRNPYWMLQAGARSLTAVDVDARSLEAAKANLAAFDNAIVRRCSADELDPDELGMFDRVTRIGVLHHLGSPNEALDRMWSCVAPGGDLVLWCYGREGNGLLLPIIQAFRWIGSRLPLPLARGLATVLTALAWPLFHGLPWKTEYYANLKKLSFRNVESIILDQMIPRTSNYWSRADMEQLLAPLDGHVMLEQVQGNSWHARVNKNR